MRRLLAVMMLALGVFVHHDDHTHREYVAAGGLDAPRTAWSDSTCSTWVSFQGTASGVSLTVG